MPIYMDRHDVAEEVTAEIVAEIHQEDLRIQHKYGCRGITYWYDDGRKTAFCLVEAPNKEAIVEMHAKAHGEVPNTIIEVDDTIVESFLGRIEDPEKSQKKELNIVNNPAFRILLVLKVTKDNLQSAPATLSKSTLETIRTLVESYRGRMVKQAEAYLLISYDSTTNAINSALAIKEVLATSLDISVQSFMGLSAGLPVTKKQGLFEETIKTAERLSDLSQGRILITSEIRDLYESENLNHPINKNFIRTIRLADEDFLNNVMNHLEKEWRNPTLGVSDFCTSLGLSTSQLYRKMTTVIHKSVNVLVQDFRLHNALELVRKKDKNISEIAFITGFNSAAYFTKCFQKKYGMTPSSYRKRL